MISLPGDSQSGVEDLLTKRRSRLDLRVDRIVDLREREWGQRRRREGEPTRLKRVGTESNTFGFTIPTASKISSLLGHRAIAEP
jgi:hypothetical protein